MAIINFAYTTPQFLNGQKTVTRRQWKLEYFQRWQRFWDMGYHIHDAYNKSPRSGGKKIGRFRLTCRPYLEKLKDMPESDLAAEGGLWETLEDFWGETDPETKVAVIRFEKIEEKKNCNYCGWWRNRNSTCKGVLIPDGTGKCTRPEGHCDPDIVRGKIGQGFIIRRKNNEL